MLRFSANLGFLWPELPLLERIHAAADAGFSAVECHWPYDTDPAAVREALNETGLPMLALNTAPGNMDNGDFGLGAVPGREAEARQTFCRAVDYACAIGASRVHAMAGICQDSRVALHQMYNHLAWAGPVAQAAGLEILIEPINRTDRPGYALFQVSQAIDLIHRLEIQEDIRNVRLMFDCYHVQMTEGNVLTRLTEALPWLGHIQVAGVPGRHEPDNCEIDYGWLFGEIGKLDYHGWIGAEYLPREGTDSGLSWFTPWRNESKPASRNPPLIFRHFCQDALDAEYNNRNKVTDFEGYLSGYIRRSEETRQAMDGRRNIAFGPSTEETLDIFYPGRSPGSGDRFPIHVFFHGGYWQALSKDEFSYVANATRGLDSLCVVVNYALIPGVDMDELVTQCRRSLVWLWHHAAEFGGDPQRIIISGHSAGGHLVGMMAATDWPSLDSDCSIDLVKAGLAVSGLMDLEPIRLCYLNDVLGMDVAMSQRNSPTMLDNRSTARVNCVYGSLEGEEYRRQSDSLAARWTHTSSRALPDHDHFSIAMQLDDPGSELSLELQGLMGLKDSDAV